MILFAFAGNMDVGQFSKTVPSAKKISVAKLPGYKFVFNKTAEDGSSKANIALSDDPTDMVWGVLIQINDDEKANFYNEETFSIDFRLHSVSCLDVNDEIHHAEAFVAQPHAVNLHLLPYDWYHQKVIQLAKNAGLPDAYIKTIAQMNFKVDPENERRLKRLKQLKKDNAG
ncbi:gamma-glutamylcyclotransferase family protein [Mucilaginibacter sp.]|uniref:gamma-glutamylcyclotransferase family protein n=1 Tax=Mucilaginibacter sp. TaxID=1882438 RepID=UPI003D0E5133